MRAILDPMRRAARGAALAACLFAAGAARSAPVTFTVIQGGDTEVVFTSKAPLESFDGRTGAVSGWCRFDPDDLSAGVALEIAVELATFDTGLSKRNQHMRENHLETALFPRAVFRGGAIGGPGEAAPWGSLPPGQPVVVPLAGTLDLHGAERAMSCDVELVRGADDNLAVSTGFTVRLSDHAIERPKFLVMKLADEQAVRVRLAMEKQP